MSLNNCVLVVRMCCVVVLCTMYLYYVLCTCCTMYVLMHSRACDHVIAHDSITQMDSTIQTKLDGFACMRHHVARQELLDSTRRSNKKPKKKKHKRKHKSNAHKTNKHKSAPLALASSTTTITVHRYALSSQTARRSRRPVGSGKLKLQGTRQPTSRTQSHATTPDPHRRPVGTGKLKLKLKLRPTPTTQPTSPHVEQIVPIQKTRMMTKNKVKGVHHRKTPTRKQPARAANTRLRTYDVNARRVTLCCKGTSARGCRVDYGEASKYQATIPTIQCLEIDLVNDSECLEQQCKDKRMHTSMASAWKIMGSRQQLLVEKQAGLIGPNHSSNVGTSDSDEDYGGTHWTTSATMRWALHVTKWEVQKDKEWDALEGYLREKKKMTPEWAPTWAMGRTRATSSESPERWIPHDR